MAAKYLHNKKLFLITLKNIAHYYNNGFEENIYIYIYIYIYKSCKSKGIEYLSPLK